MHIQSSYLYPATANRSWWGFTFTRNEVSRMAKGVHLRVKNYSNLESSIENLKSKSAIAASNTVKDMKSRAPGWIAAAVTTRYNIKKSEITPLSSSAKKPQKKAGSISVRGETIENLQFVYKGRLLTPTHFAMTPRQRPRSTKDENGKTIKKARGYQVSAEIIKGQRKILGSKVFLGTNKGTADIPFQRVGSGRKLIEAIKTLSVPQMIENEDVAVNIMNNLNVGLKARMEHNIKRQKL